MYPLQNFSSIFQPHTKKPVGASHVWGPAGATETRMTQQRHLPTRQSISTTLGLRLTDTCPRTRECNVPNGGGTPEVPDVPDNGFGQYVLHLYIWYILVAYMKYCYTLFILYIFLRYVLYHAKIQWVCMVCCGTLRNICCIVLCLHLAVFQPQHGALTASHLAVSCWWYLRCFLHPWIHDLIVINFQCLLCEFIMKIPYPLANQQNPKMILVKLFSDVTRPDPKKVAFWKGNPLISGNIKVGEIILGYIGYSRIWPDDWERWCSFPICKAVAVRY